MARSDIKAGSAFVELYVKRSAFNSALTDAEARVKNFGAGLVAAGAGVAALGTGIIGTLTGAIAHFASAGDELDKMAARTGVSAQALAQLGFAAEQSGTNMATVESSIRRMQRAIGDANQGTQTAVESFEALGLTVSELQGLAPEEQFTMITERLGAIADPTLRAAAAMEVFGRSGTALIPMLGSVQALRDEASDLGLAPSPESVAAAAQITDAINRVRRVIAATFFEIGASLAPIALEVLAGFLQMVSAVRRFVTENRNLIVVAAKLGAVLVGVGTAIVAIGTAVIGLGALFGAVSFAMTGFAAAVGAVVSVASLLGAALAAVVSPIGLIVAGLAAAVTGFLFFTQAGQSVRDSIGAAFAAVVARVREAINEVLSVLSSMRDALAAGDMALAAQIGMTALRVVFARSVAGIVQTINGLSEGLGDTVATMIGQITSGDFAGAWNTVVLNMSNVWSSFSNGIVSTFVNASRAVLDVWVSTVDALTNYILQKAGEGGAFGAMFEQISGVDVKAELERKKSLDAQSGVVRQNIESGMEEINQELDIAIAQGDQEAIATLNEQLAAMQQNLRDLEAIPTPDIFDEVAAGTFSGSGTQDVREAIEGGLDALQAQSDSSAEAASEALDSAIAGGTAAATDEVAKLEKELADLQAMAANKRKEAEEGGAGSSAGEPGADGQGTGTGKGNTSQAFFSAAALLASSQGGDQPAVREMTGVRKAAEKQVGLLDEIKVSLANMALNHP